MRGALPSQGNGYEKSGGLNGRRQALARVVLILPSPFHLAFTPPVLFAARLNKHGGEARARAGRLPKGEEMSEETKYTLDYHTRDDPDPQGPPFKYRSHYLDDVLAEAWQVENLEGRSLRITRAGETIFDAEALQRAFARLRELEGEQPGGDRRAWAAQVIQELADVGGQA